MRALLRPPAWLLYFYLVASVIFGFWGGRHLYEEQKVIEEKQWQALTQNQAAKGYVQYLNECKFCFYQREAAAKVAYFAKIDELFYQQALRYDTKEAYQAYESLCHLCAEK